MRQQDKLSRAPGAFCWNCGEQKDRRDFREDETQRDGLERECRHCAEMRELAARIDAEAGRPAWGNGRMDGDGKKRHEWHQEGMARSNLAKQAVARRRSPAGLMPQEGWGAAIEGMRERGYTPGGR